MGPKRSPIFQFFDNLLKNPYFLISPAILIVLVMTVYPTIYGIIISFTNYSITEHIGVSPEFVGFRNYLKHFNNSVFQLVLRNTFVYMISVVIGIILISVLLGLFLNKTNRVYTFVQSVVFSPSILSFVSVAILFAWLYDNDGLFNYLLITIGREPLRWLRDERTSLLSIIIVAVWKDIGYGSLLIIAGLQSIPTYVYESAKLDNANPWTTLTKITLPMLSPTLFFMLITFVINSFRAFDVSFNMTKGGPRSSSLLLVQYIYDEGYRNFRMGSAMAASIILFIIVSAISFINFKFISNKVHYQ